MRVANRGLKPTATIGVSLRDQIRPKELQGENWPLVA